MCVTDLTSTAFHHFSTLLSVFAQVQEFSARPHHSVVRSGALHGEATGATVKRD